MKIAGMQKNSFVDYPGKIAACIFLSGCNMDCFYCHNRELLAADNNDFLCSTDVIKFLEDRKSFLEGVVISGGEPTLHIELEEFIFRIKQIGYPVKLDTNGTNPEMLERLISKELIDYVAMDIKAPFDKYEEVCRTNVCIDKIKSSINLLLNGKIPYEFRTTFIPQLGFDDIKCIVGGIKDAPIYVLQQFRNNFSVQNSNNNQFFETPHTPDYIQETVNQIKDTVKHCQIRGLPFS